MPALLVAAEFSTLYDVRVVTAVPEGGSFSAGGHHGYALAVIAVAIVVMALGAVLGGSRPAAVAVLVLALGALAIALLVDLPDVHETGLIGRTYDAARAEPRAGLYLEIAGGCAALLGAALILVARPAPRAPVAKSKNSSRTLIPGSTPRSRVGAAAQLGDRGLRRRRRARRSRSAPSSQTSVTPRFSLREPQRALDVVGDLRARVAQHHRVPAREAEVAQRVDARVHARQDREPARGLARQVRRGRRSRRGRRRLGRLRGSGGSVARPKGAQLPVMPSTIPGSRTRRTSRARPGGCSGTRSAAARRGSNVPRQRRPRAPIAAVAAVRAAARRRAPTAQPTLRARSWNAPWSEAGVNTTRPARARPAGRSCTARRATGDLAQSLPAGTHTTKR